MQKLFLSLLLFFNAVCGAEDGYRLWLRYDKRDDEQPRQYGGQITCFHFYGNSSRQYQCGVDTVRWTQCQWDRLPNQIDEVRFGQASTMLVIQEKEAVWWPNTCLLYFGTFSGRPFPDGFEKAEHSSEYYKSLRFPHTQDRETINQH